MALSTILGRSRHAGGTEGYALLILMFAVTVMGLGLMVAVPVWETQLQREKEAELIFRGKQYVEGVRLWQLKNPGAFPKTLEEMVEKKCLRRLYKDPMAPEGSWNVILQMEGFGGLQQTPAAFAGPSRGSRPGLQQQLAGGTSPQKVMVAPVEALSSIQNPRIIGVVSSSTKKSIRIYNDQESYDKWLFFYGQDPEKMPEIVYYGKTEKKS